MLDYCYLCASESRCDATRKEQLGILCRLIIIKPEGKSLALVIDFSKFGNLVIQWLEQPHSIGYSEEANRVSHKLCDLLFPPEVRKIIEDDSMKRMFPCPDLLMTRLPLDLILFPDNTMLHQKCAITLLSSSQEILHGAGGALLEEQMRLSFEETPSGTKNPITASESNHCMIFANPNLDLEISHQQQATSITHLIYFMSPLQ